MSAVEKPEQAEAPSGLVILRDMVAGATDRLAGSGVYGSSRHKYEAALMNVISMPADSLEVVS